MSALPHLAITTPEFSSDAVLENRRLRIELHGNADLRAREPLTTVLTQLHNEALNRHVEEVSVDFRGLEFLNSSCFKSFVTWLSRANELPRERRYRIRFLSDPESHWQRRSLHALKCFGADIVSLD